MWWGRDAATWTALAAWATVAIYVFLGIFALVQVLQARKLREEQARPFVVVDFDPARELFFLVIENIGRTVARNVVVRFDKPLTRSFEGSVELDEAPLFREPIPFLAPGKRIRVAFDTLPRRRERGLPLAYEATVRYEGPTGRKYGKGESYRLDMGMYAGAAGAEKGLPDLVDEVESIRKELAKWRQGTRGLLVHAVDKRWQDRREWRRFHVRTLRREGPKAFARQLWQRALWRLGVR
jgi:hypothetical protein